MPIPSSPPPPPKKDGRKHPRYEMMASVEVHSGAETVILPARNISLGGVYLARDGHDLSGFGLGAELQLLVFDALDERHEPVRLAGQVVRHDALGMALMWAYSDPETPNKLGRLLEALHSKAP
jgi:hypothetical protein